MTTISIICPTLNEEKYIEGAIDSFLAQEHSTFEIEILIVDGMSKDRTRGIVQNFERKFSSVRLLNNANSKTPFAFNIGLSEAKGEFVAILGAHTHYASDYLETCYKELLKYQAAGCTGKIISRAPSTQMQAKMVEWIMDNPFGVSGSSFRTMKEGYTHSVNFAVFRKKNLIELGGYDTDMFRNQDNDMNQRLLDAGNKLYCTWKTQCYYFTPSTVQKLFLYGFNNGYWNAFSLLTKTRSMRPYHFIPFVFLMSLFVLMLAGVAEYILFASFYSTVLLSSTIILYLFLSIIFTGYSIVKKSDSRKLLLPVFFFAFHASYGWGTFKGFVHKLIFQRA
jgi:glycosyltransferase involved in cell wall biosynthesis